jgi:hypothetical protein
MTVSRWIRQLVADGFLVQPWKHERGSLKAARYQTAEAAAKCDQHDLQQRSMSSIVYGPMSKAMGSTRLRIRSVWPDSFGLVG